MSTSLLYQTIDQLSREKGIDPQIIIAAVEDAILVATRKYYKSNEDLRSHFDKDTGQAYQPCQVNPSSDTEITLLGDLTGLAPLSYAPFGR